MMSEKVMSLKDLKGYSHIAQHVVWDYEPKRLTEPVRKTTGEERPEGKSQDYIFHIETMDKKPGAFPHGCQVSR